MAVPKKWIIKYNEENEIVFVVEKSNRGHEGMNM